MIGSLHGEVKALGERAPNNPSVKLVPPSGYDPAAVRPAPGGPTPPAAALTGVAARIVRTSRR